MDQFNLSAWNGTFLLMNKYIEQYPWKMSHLGTRTNTFPCKFPLRWFCIRLSPENRPKNSGNISWDPWDEAISPANAWKIAKPGSWDARTTFTGLPSTWTHIALRCTKDTERIWNSFRIILLMGTHYYLLFLLFEYAARCVLGRGNVNKSPVFGGEFSSDFVFFYFDLFFFAMDFPSIVCSRHLLCHP